MLGDPTFGRSERDGARTALPPLLPCPSGGLAPQRDVRDERFARFVAPEIPVLVRLARRLAPPSDADDLVQETLMRAYRAVDRFDGAHPRAWVCTILRNVWKNSLRAWRPIAAAPDHRPLDQMAPPAQDAGEDAAARLLDPGLMSGLAALPRAQRAVVALMDLDGYTYQETADVLGLPKGTVMSRLHRGRKKLRDGIVEQLIDAAHHAGPSRSLDTWSGDGGVSGDALLDGGLLDTVVRQEPVIVFAFDPKGVITQRRGHGLLLLGQPQGAGVGRSVFDLHRDAPSVLRHAERALAGETTVATVDVGAATFEVHQWADEDDAGRPAGVVGVAVAVHPRRGRRRAGSNISHHASIASAQCGAAGRTSSPSQRIARREPRRGSTGNTERR